MIKQFIYIILSLFFLIELLSCDDCTLIFIIKNEKSTTIKIVSNYLMKNQGVDSANNHYSYINTNEKIKIGSYPYCDFETSALPDFLTIIAADTVIHFSNQEELAKMFHCEGKMKGDRCKSGTWVYEVK